MKGFNTERAGVGRFFDRVGDHRLQSGDKVRVTWPDEATTAHVVTVVEDRDRRAWVGLSYHGATVRVELGDLPNAAKVELVVDEAEFQGAVRKYGYG